MYYQSFKDIVDSLKEIKEVMIERNKIEKEKLEFEKAKFTELPLTQVLNGYEDHTKEEYSEECNHDWEHIGSEYNPMDMRYISTYVCRKCGEKETDVHR